MYHSEIKCKQKKQSRWQRRHMFIEKCMIDDHSTRPGSYFLCVVAISINMSTRRVEEAETNKVVYQLYGLTDEEKQRVENVGDVPQPIGADSHIY